MWEQMGVFARAANENGVPAITDPWPTKDVRGKVKLLRAQR